MCRRMKVDPYFTPYTKSDSKGIGDLNAGVKTMKLLEEHTGVNLFDLGFGTECIDMPRTA